MEICLHDDPVVLQDNVVIRDTLIARGPEWSQLLVCVALTIRPGIDDHPMYLAVIPGFST